MTDSIDAKPVSDYTLAELWSLFEETLRHLRTEYQVSVSSLALLECVAHEVLERARRVPQAWRDRIPDTESPPSPRRV